MKRVLHIVLALILVMTMFTANMIPVAYADETYHVTFPLTVNVTGSRPIEGAYAEFTLTALTEGAPMPANADADGRIYLELTQKGQNTGIISMAYPEQGVYRYTIQMTGGTYYHEGIQDTKYKVDVYNLSDDHGYENEEYDGPNFFQIYTGIGGTKLEKMEYDCPLRDINVAKKWVGKDATRPGSITVQVLRKQETITVPIRVNGKIKSYTYPEKKLNKANEWQGLWYGLDDLASTYSVKEKVVPAGYKASYSYQNNVYWITNTRALLQTGQLNWPIPVLGGAGGLLLIAGMLMLRRKEEEDA